MTRHDVRRRLLELVEDYLPGPADWHELDAEDVIRLEAQLLLLAGQCTCELVDPFLKPHG